MNKKTVRGQRSIPTLKLKTLSQAIAVATAGMHASAALGACPGTQDDAAVTTCTLAGGEAVTVTSDGSIIVPAGNAITLTGAGTKTITNSGTLTGTPHAIESSVGSFGTLNLTNNAAGTIRGQNAGVRINGGYTLVIDNAGTIRAVHDDSSGQAAALAILGDFDENSSIDNSGTIQALADGTSGSANAAGILITGTMGGSIDNTGTISAGATSTRGATSESGFLFGNAFAAGISIDSAVLASGSITNSGTISATATGNSASAQAYGIYIGSGTAEGGFSTSLLGSITNSGTISATATGDFGASATGIYLEEDMVGPDAVLTNSGTITVSASGNGNGDAEAAGIYVDGNLLGGASVVNTASGVITVTATGDTAEATGILIDRSIDVDSTLTNAGTITVTATGTTESATAYGIYVDDDLAGTLTNSGTINVTAIGASTAEAYGIYISSTVTDTGNLTNSGTIDVTAQGGSEATAAGIYIEENLEGTVLNSGDITVLAEGSTSAEAYGIFVESSMTAGSTLTNSGSIDVTANATSSGSATAVGLYLSGTVAGAVLNSGTITANATGGFDGGEGIAIAAGILVDSSLLSGATLVNSGTIVAIADGSSSIAGGILVEAARSGSSITNSGTITVTSNFGGTSEAGFSNPGAVGIGVSFLETGATLLNSGTVTANTNAGVGTGWAVFIQSGGASEGGGLALMSNTGNLYGNVRMNGTSLNNTGLLSIPVSTGGFNDSSFIGGNYTQSGEGVLEIGAFSTTLYGRLVVAGTADISANGRLAVNVSANDMLVSAGILDNVVSAGTLITGNNMTVTDNSALWDFTALNDGENGIDLLISGGISVTDAVTDNGPRWALGAAGALDDIISGGEAGGDMANVIANLSTLPESAQLAGAAAQMVPVMVGRGVQQANLSLSGLSGMIAGRMDTVRAGLVDAASHDQNLWFRMYGTTGEQDDEGEFSAYETESYGFVIGYDRNLDSGWNVGGAIGYSQPSVESESTLIDDEIDIDSYHAALYGYRDVGNNTFVDLMAMVGMSNNDSSRHIMFAGINRTAQADYDSWYGRVSAAIGHSIPLGDQVTLTPVVSLAYTQVEDDSYTETGAAALNLNVDENDVESLVVGLDLRLAFQMSESTRLTAHAGYGFDALTDSAGVSSSFVGGGPVFQTSGLEPDGKILRGGLAADVVATDTMEVHVQYEYENRDDWDNNLLTATLRWKI